MPVAMTWLYEDRLFVVQFIGEVTLEDIENGARKTHTMVEDSTAPTVHVIHDYSRMTGFPRSLRLISTLSRSTLSHPRRGWIVAFGIQNTLAQFIAQGVTNMSQIHMRVVPTWEAALHTLTRIDIALPDNLQRPELLDEDATMGHLLS
ncbi:MAG: hypothetical protein AAFV33_02590 [Chloroflexota bacterium]